MSGGFCRGGPMWPPWVGDFAHPEVAPTQGGHIGPPLLVLLLLLGCRAAPLCVGSPVLRIAVQPGDYIHAVADQRPQAVPLTLFDSRGRQLLKVDSLNAPNSPPRPEEIHWVADAPGELRIEPSLVHGPKHRPCA